jgi:hypothetical protein
MKFNPRWETFFNGLGWISLGAGLVASLLSFIVPLPSRMLLLSALYGLVPLSWLMARLFHYRDHGPYAEVSCTVDSQKNPNWLLWFQITLSVFIFGQATYGLYYAPLNFDEQNISYGLLKTNWHRVNPLLSESHPIPTLLSLISMEVFGPSKVSVNLPSLLFLALFLWTLNRYCRRYVSTLGSVIILLHLAVNQMFGWYAHSMRGYISMMFACTLALGWATDFTRAHFSEKKFWGLAAFFLFGFLLHSFVAIYALVLLLSLGLWLSFQLKSLSRNQIESGCRLLLGGVFLLIPSLIILKLHQSLLARAANHYLDTNQAAPYRYEFWSPVIARLVGYDNHDWLPVLLTVFWGLFVLGIFRVKRRREELRSIFSSSYLLFFSGLVIVTGCCFLEARFFLGLLPLLVFSLTENASKLSSKTVRIGAGALIVFSLVILPAVTSRAAYETLTDHNEAYDHFMRKTASYLKNEGEYCLTVSGEVQKTYLAKAMYLRGQSPEISSTICKKRFHLSLNEESADVPKAFANLKASMIYQDQSGDRLLEFGPTVIGQR